jgi:hypothetical protein
MPNVLAVHAQVTLMTTFFFDVDTQSTTKAFAAHPVYELLAGVGSVDVHSNRFGSWGNKQIAQERGLRSGRPGCNSGVFLLPLFLCMMPADMNINTGSDSYQLIESSDGMSGM